MKKYLHPGYPVQVLVPGVQNLHGYLVLVLVLGEQKLLLPPGPVLALGVQRVMERALTTQELDNIGCLGQYIPDKFIVVKLVSSLSLKISLSH